MDTTYWVTIYCNIRSNGVAKLGKIIFVVCRLTCGLIEKGVFNLCHALIILGQVLQNGIICNVLFFPDNIVNSIMIIKSTKRKNIVFDINNLSDQMWAKLKKYYTSWACGPEMTYLINCFCLLSKYKIICTIIFFVNSFKLTLASFKITQSSFV